VQSGREVPLKPVTPLLYVTGFQVGLPERATEKTKRHVGCQSAVPKKRGPPRRRPFLLGQKNKNRRDTGCAMQPVTSQKPT
jgi:hypothetical protein